MLPTQTSGTVAGISTTNTPNNDNYYKSPTGDFVNVSNADKSLQGGKIYTAEQAGIKNNTEPTTSNPPTPPAPTPTPPTGTGTGTTSPTGTTPTGSTSVSTTGSTGNSNNGIYQGTDQQKNDISTAKTNLGTAQDEYQTESKRVLDQILGIQNGTVPLNAGEQAQVAGVTSAYQDLIQQQRLINTSAQGTANIRGYQTGAAEYDPTFQTKTIGTIISKGVSLIADLNTKMASAVATLTQSLKDNDIKAVKDAFSIYQDASKARTNALQKTIDDTNSAIKQAKDDLYNQVQKPIQDIVLEAKKNGADANTIAKISGAGSVNDAINNAGDWLQTATGQMGDWLQYKRDALAKGLVPLDWSTWKVQDDKRQANLKSSEAYSTAYGAAAGKAAAEAKFGNPDASVPTPDPTATGLTAAAGISLQAFNYLTQGTASMSRLPAGQRNQIMKEANDFLNKNGLDVSTFQSQYKSYNDVLQKNIQRANQTKVMAGEVSGSADALIDAIGNTHGMTNIRAANILDLLAGKETNSANAMKYATQLRFMANDLAGYLAAARGANSPELQDQNDAAQIIANGLSTKSTKAFKESVQTNEEKVNGVVNNAVNDAQKQVWDLFGVGSQYQPKTPQINPKDAVNSYVKSNPTQASTIAKLYVPGATDQDVLDYINKLNNK